MRFREHGGLLEAETSLLLVVDMQLAFQRGLKSFPSILPRAVQLLNAARVLEIPTWGSEQSPGRMGATVPDILDVLDSRRIFPKESFSALQNKEIREAISASKPKSVVILGCETHVSVLQTTLQLLSSFDGQVHVVLDATASRRDLDRDLAIERMRRAGVHVTSTEMVQFEWLRDTRHPGFAAVSQASQRNSSVPGSAFGI
ncbi:MAG: isochorismatase family protein [Fibrobacteria bacterium]|nr:isochorismatase family protein [Fibrobacteria bacterium]